MTEYIISGELKAFSNGEDLILVQGDTVWIAKKAYAKSFNLNIHFDEIESSVFETSYRKMIAGPRIIEVDLSFIAFEAEYLKGKVDIDKILFKNKTILDLVRMVRSKVDDRDKDL